MQTRRVVRIGFQTDNRFRSDMTVPEFYALLSNKTFAFGRLLLILRDYLIVHTNTFEEVQYIPSSQPARVFPNGTLTGLIRYLNESKGDFSIQTQFLDERTAEAVDYAYPFKLRQYTFVTPKPVYRPQVFGILQTFSVSVWISILCVLFTLLLIYYAILRRNYTFQQIFLHLLAVLVRQSVIVRPSTTAKKLLVYSWVLGSMLLCLAYDSVFLSFLSFPPLTQIKDVWDLAAAVERGEYRCLGPLTQNTAYYMAKSNIKPLKIIAKCLLANIKMDKIYTYFIRESRHQLLAFVVRSDGVLAFPKQFFIPKEKFFETLYAMPVSKTFCCKDILDTFVHKMMASGLFTKIFSDNYYFIGLPVFLKNTENETGQRPLVLTDLAPAFMVLLAGYTASGLVFLWEVLSGRKKRRKVHTDGKVRKKKNKKIRKVLRRGEVSV